MRSATTGPVSPLTLTAIPSTQGRSDWPCASTFARSWPRRVPAAADGASPLRRPACAIVAAMPARRLDPQRLLAAVEAQQAAIGAEPYAGPVTAAALGAACLDLVIEAIAAGQQPLREALRSAPIHSPAFLDTPSPPPPP